MFRSLFISIFVNIASVLKKINSSFIVHFCFGKYSFSLGNVWKHLILRKISILFSVYFCLGKYSFIFDSSFSSCIFLNLDQNYLQFISSSANPYWMKTLSWPFTTSEFFLLTSGCRLSLQLHVRTRPVVSFWECSGQ